MTASLTVVAATVLGMGMPTPITYLLLAMFAAPALIECGSTVLSAHLFLFYFAIKSGSTPPVALVAVVAASIAEANWFRTAMTAFIHSLPGFAVAFMFLYQPALLFDGASDEIIFAILKATLAVLAITSGIQGWLLSWLSLGERLVLILSGIAVFNELLTINLVGFILISAIFFFRYFYPEVKIIK